MGRPSTSVDEYFDRSTLKIEIWYKDAECENITHREKLKIKNKIAALKSRMSTKTKHCSESRNFAGVQSNFKEFAKLVSKVSSEGAD